MGFTGVDFPDRQKQSSGLRLEVARMWLLVASCNFAGPPLEHI